jgi:hypothetical protein
MGMLLNKRRKAQKKRAAEAAAKKSLDIGEKESLQDDEPCQVDETTEEIPLGDDPETTIQEDPLELEKQDLEELQEPLQESTPSKKNKKK